MVTFARRAQNQAAAELTTILAGAPAGGAPSLAGGFPNPATFPSELLDELVARLVRDEPAWRSSTRPARASPACAST